ncbi:MAG: hypothetical protein HOJ31_10345 [Anaerolineae bacterium]|jgi:hypothetical protein|nr:hypothetical protein [Candidatus Scalindua sp.]MBT6322571.1 hypothetical protein [Anaerolineae bacterium]
MGLKLLSEKTNGHLTNFFSTEDAGISHYEGDPIDIGSAAINRVSTQVGGYTFIALDNPANDTGTINEATIYSDTNLVGAVLIIFERNTTNTFTPRSFAVLGAVTAGGDTFSGLSLAVETGDFVALYWDTGALDVVDTGGAGCYYKSGDQSEAGIQTYVNTGTSARDISVYATGIT